jgi:TRAP-type uncharacterized transport system fused permease subunit
MDDGKPKEDVPFWRSVRAANIACRTGHIAVSGVLVGGHLFNVPAIRLLPWLIATIVTGIVLVALESRGHWRWSCQGRGQAVLLKLCLLFLVPIFWDQRVWLLFIVIVLASVGSHMPARFRYYSWIHGREL